MRETMKSSAVKAILMVNFCALAVTIFAINHPLQSTYKNVQAGGFHDVKTGQYVYHICSLSQWEKAKKFGYYAPKNSPFIHLSTAKQLIRPNQKFKLNPTKNNKYVVLTIEYEKIAGDIKWEGNTDLFPHLYGNLPVEVVVNSTPLTFNEEGRPILPSEILIAATA